VRAVAPAAAEAERGQVAVWGGVKEQTWAMVRVMVKVSVNG